ncbi:MAG: HAMP domain-containing histidine kinase [Parvularculaceae bacterium]|nr:HAMP domain-containing histidine kinase [Parvularculaceae bacterium]
MAGFSSRLAEGGAVRRAEAAARAARAEAELSIRARSEFLANMNHELRTPLNAIIGFSTMLKEGETYRLSDEQRAAYADYVLQSADLLLGHINTILEIAALDSGGVAMRKGATDLAEVVSAAVARASVAASAAGAAVENKTAGSVPAAWADPERLGQAVDHLLRTAVKSSPKGGRILIRAAVGKDGAPEIAVRDHGAGYEPEALRKALGVFDEVHRGLDRSFSGAGVELAIAKTFVEMQGGQFHIKSRTGEGTVVRVALPLADAAGVKTRTEAVVAPARRAG